MLCHVTPEHTVQVECMADIHLVNCVFLLQLSHPFVPILKLLFFLLPSSLRYIFPLRKGLQFLALPWNTSFLKSKKEECFTWFESEDTCSSVSGVQFRASS